jgi:amidase/6-aminohexanoate-cyclic-dimer hydrolase
VPDAAFANTAPFADYDGLGLADLVRRKEISPVELLTSAITHAEAVNPTINCFAHRHYDEARAQIASGLPQGVFHGVPFVIKDLGIELANTVTSSGSLAFWDQKAAADSELVLRYKRAGLVIFAKSTTPELGLTLTTESKAFGMTRNPWNLERSAGGSSGGAAAAVASGIVPMAHASDGGGSIRVPASCTGLFGLKPSRGRMPLGPAMSEPWLGLATAHAVTRSVRDSAALLDATWGLQSGSRYSAPPPPSGSFSKELNQAPGTLRIALMLTSPTGSPIDPECIAAARACARLCESLGHPVEEASPVLDAAALNAGFLAVVKMSVAQALRDRGAQRGLPVSAEEVEAVTWIFADQGAKATALMIADANAAFQVAATAMGNFLTRFDVLLSPTLAKPPAKLGVLGLSPVDWAVFTKEITTYSPFTAVANMTGQPSMSVPLHWTPNGLPVGLMFTGRYGEEAGLLRLAAQLERAQPWARKVIRHAPWRSDATRAHTASRNPE